MKTARERLAAALLMATLPFREAYKAMKSFEEQVKKVSDICERKVR